MPLARLKRLEPLLVSTQGDVMFNIRFGYDEQRRANAVVEVEAPLLLMCQSSLEPYTENVNQRTRLLIIGEPEEQATLSDQEEFILVSEGRMAVANLVEDELLLAVPQIPRNPELETVVESTAGETAQDIKQDMESSDEGRQRPFESLAELMKDR